MISLVDSTYYERAWCAVEVMMMRAVLESYSVHQWWEHAVVEGGEGSLEKGELRSFHLPDLAQC